MNCSDEFGEVLKFMGLPLQIFGKVFYLFKSNRFSSANNFDWRGVCLDHIHLCNNLIFLQILAQSHTSLVRQTPYCSNRGTDIRTFL